MHVVSGRQERPGHRVTYTSCCAGIYALYTALRPIRQCVSKW